MTVNVKVSLAALQAARDSFAGKGNISDLVKAVGVSRSTGTGAKTVVEFGTQEEIKAVEEGLVGVRTMGETIRKRLAPEVRAEVKRRTGKRNSVILDNWKLDATLWAKLGPSLRNLNSLPSPADMIELISRNQMRETAINNNLNQAVKWLEEFTHEWAKYQLAKSANHLANSGGSDTAAGTQHPEQAA